MGLFSKAPDMTELTFQLRMSSKQLEREAKKAEKEEKGQFFISFGKIGKNKNDSFFCKIYE